MGLDMDVPELLLPRDIGTCTTGKLWYVCTAGGFRGCCSSDPCTIGICPDNDSSSATFTTASSDTSSQTTAGTDNRVTAKTTTTSAITTPTETLTVSSADSSTTISVSTASSTITDSSTSGASGATALSSLLATSSSTPTSIPKAASSNRGAIIGEVLGAVVALALFAILIFWRRRKQHKHEKRSTVNSCYLYRKHRAAGSGMKGPLSPCDSEASRSPTSSSVSPSSTANTHPSVLTPNLTLNSSSPHLISHSPQKLPTPPIPPLANTNELYASIPPRIGLTPELSDTGFYRLRAELASNSQSELINVPVNQRRRQQNSIRTRAGPRAWESPSLASIAASPRASPVRETANAQSGYGDGSGGLVNAVGRVVTSEGIVLGANLDRYSNGLEIGDALVRERGRSAEREPDRDHVLSFMQYGEGSRGGSDGLGIRGALPLDDNDVMRDRGVDGLGHGADEVILDVDIPPAYETNERPVQPEIQSPARRMGMSLRGV